jgi:protease I
MGQKLDAKKVAILVADGFEQVELTEPKKALEQAGAVTHIVFSERQTRGCLSSHYASSSLSA